MDPGHTSHWRHLPFQGLQNHPHHTMRVSGSDVDSPLRPDPHCVQEGIHPGVRPGGRFEGCNL